MKITTLLSRLLNRINLWGHYRHLYRIKQSKKILQKLHHIANLNKDSYYGRIIGYLRKINAYVFEELILTVIENNNTHIIRNKSYSNDGGIDGIIRLKQGKVLIQCKRYKSHINNRHVQDLCKQVKDGGYYYGLFVHTGKTGEKSRDTIKGHKVMFLSGQTLVDFLLGKQPITNLIENHLSRTSRDQRHRLTT